VAPLASLFHVLLALVVITVAARAAGRCSADRPAPVIGEVGRGDLLARRCWVALAGAYGFILPNTVWRRYLGVLSQIGVILYMFLVGLELDVGQIPAARGRVDRPSRTRASSCRSRSARSGAVFIRDTRRTTSRSRVSRCYRRYRCR